MFGCFVEAYIMVRQIWSLMAMATLVVFSFESSLGASVHVIASSVNKILASFPPWINHHLRNTHNLDEALCVKNLLLLCFTC